MKAPIYLVSGLPRSGTSMMMRVLQAGGLPIMTDGQRRPDEDNPRGYFELEKSKSIARDSAWVGEAQGKVVKLVAPLLRHLPAGPRYRIIFMRRNIGEVVASQRQMLERRGEPPGPDAAESYRLMLGAVVEVEDWLRGRSDLETLFVSYNRMVHDPLPEVTRVARFMGGDLPVDRMAAAVDVSLYRQRDPAGPPEDDTS